METKTKPTEKDLQIIRQSQLKLTMDYFSACGACPSMTDLLKVTTMLENFVVNGYRAADLPKYEALDKFINDNYKTS